MISDMFNLAGFQIPECRAIKPLRSKYASRYQVDGGDPDEGQAMLVSVPQTQASSELTTAATTRQTSAVTNKDNNDDGDDSNSSSSSESDDDEADGETDRPFYVTDRRISTRKLSVNERNKHIYYCQNYQNEVISPISLLPLLLC